MYAMSHSLSIPHRNMPACIVFGVKPYELICHLVVERGLSHELGKGALPLAKALGLPHRQSALHKFLAGEVHRPHPDSAAQLAAFFDLPLDAVYDERVATAIAAERGIAPRARRESLTPVTKVPAKRPERAQNHPLVNRPLGESSITMSPAPIRWGDVRMDELRGVVDVILEDDAMAPDFPAGVVIRFDTADRSPQFGNRVMVQDAAGGLHFRMYAQAPGGGWHAIASSPAFQPLRPEDGAKVVAVKTGHFVNAR